MGSTLVGSASGDKEIRNGWAAERVLHPCLPVCRVTLGLEDTFSIMDDPKRKNASRLRSIDI